MANIFKKVRQRHLMNNRFTRYLVYALGEILLVVIGILIALQVNNLNEQRKSNAKEEKYLVSMRSELMINLDLVNKEIDDLSASACSTEKVNGN